MQVPMFYEFTTQFMQNVYYSFYPKNYIIYQDVYKENEIPAEFYLI
jgi:hypothetical protein